MGVHQSYADGFITMRWGQEVTAYEAPSITKVGTVADLTQGNIFQRGQDSISWIPFGGPIPGWPPPGGGGGFGS